MTKMNLKVGMGNLATLNSSMGKRLLGPQKKFQRCNLNLFARASISILYITVGEKQRRVRLLRSVVCPTRPGTTGDFFSRHLCRREEEE